MEEIRNMEKSKKHKVIRMHYMYASMEFHEAIRNNRAHGWHGDTSVPAADLPGSRWRHTGLPFVCPLRG